eukprot:Hpha_TRINITY_DN23824_c0_g1::TRINITY_DN23824_c0_g1_i1::g.109915::m.109915/K00166/BCKDHA, bkdA1; 2-oxoisovalerate dehydrogenase E1 component alpha subunit
MVMRAVRRFAPFAKQVRWCSGNADPEIGYFAGVESQEFVSSVGFRTRGPFPIVRQLLGTGEMAEGAEWPFDDATALRLYEVMVRSSVIDTVLNTSQRQGRISFYLTAHGEEAASAASTAALTDEDMLYPQYRELPLFIWKGLTFQQIVDGCMVNIDDPLKGRCLPAHYVMPELGVQAVKDPLGTHIAQVPGVGYGFRLRGEKKVAVAYFGDGAASEGDAPSGFNFASVMGSQTLFICRNNGFAISTPVQQQYRGDGVAARAAAVDIPCCRVDGNDPVAVYAATRAAREFALERGGPVFLELMTYRVSHHSTSDDSSLYRSQDEIDGWKNHSLSPIARFKRALTVRGMWDEARDKELRKNARSEVLRALKSGEKKLKPNPDLMFDDVYDTLTPSLQQQKAEMRRHVAAHRSRYNTENYVGI